MSAGSGSGPTYLQSNLQLILNPSNRYMDKALMGIPLDTQNKPVNRRYNNPTTTHRRGNSSGRMVQVKGIPRATTLTIEPVQNPPPSSHMG